jgi:ribonucleotide reductase alpha subunit
MATQRCCTRPKCRRRAPEWVVRPGRLSWVGSRVLPYDSDVGRDYATAITAIMHFQACLTSSRIAAQLGPFPRYEENRESFLNVFSMHRVALRKKGPRTSEELFEEARRIWDECFPGTMRHGFRGRRADHGTSGPVHQQIVLFSVPT